MHRNAPGITGKGPEAAQNNNPHLTQETHRREAAGTAPC